MSMKVLGVGNVHLRIARVGLDYSRYIEENKRLCFMKNIVGYVLRSLVF